MSKLTREIRRRLRNIEDELRTLRFVFADDLDVMRLQEKLAERPGEEPLPRSLAIAAETVAERDAEIVRLRAEVEWLTREKADARVNTDALADRISAIYHAAGTYPDGGNEVEAVRVLRAEKETAEAEAKRLRAHVEVSYRELHRRRMGNTGGMSHQQVEEMLGAALAPSKPQSGDVYRDLADDECEPSPEPCESCGGSGTVKKMSGITLPCPDCEPGVTP